MNVDLLLGMAALGYGLYTVYLRATNPGKLGKLEAMKEQWGPRAGTLAHLVAYSLIPIGLGIILLVRGLAAR
jgi:hypothetical protein